MKTCKTCVHVRPNTEFIFRFTNDRYRFAKCALTSLTTTDPLSGEQHTELTSCSMEREIYFAFKDSKRCGIDAKHWEGKTK